MSSSEDTSGAPVIRDRRRIDPATGRVRKPDPSGDGGAATTAAAAGTGGQAAGRAAAGSPGQGGSRPGPADGGAAAGQAAALTQLEERTADLQRLQAEYANYRKRVERDRMAVREQALANVLAEFLPILDAIGRAREHGELAGGFKSVAESVESAVAKLGLVSYGESGEPFDPVVHEALMHSYSAEVSEPTCVQVLQPGYKIGERILRPARVAVAEPGAEDAEEPDSAGQEGDPAQAADARPAGTAGDGG